MDGGRESIRGVESRPWSIIWILRYEAVAEIYFERIKENVPVELVEEDEGPAALASHPMTIDGSSHEEEAADCWSKLIISD